MIPPLEAVADAITHYEGWGPHSRSYRNRNPGNLRDSRLKVGEDADGYAIFPSLQFGYTALLEELGSKFSGHNVHGVTPDSTLSDLFKVYAPAGDRNRPLQYAAFVAGWLSQALTRPIGIDTKLGDIWPDARTLAAKAGS